MIVPLTIADVPAAAAVHREALATDLLPALGTAFLTRLHAAILASAWGLGFAAKDGDRVVGMVVGTTRSSEAFRSVLRTSGPALFLRALPRVLSRPGLVPKLAQTFLYPARQPDAGADAELLVIAVAPAYRSAGLGRKLVDALNGEFGRRGVPVYKVTVYESNTRACGFYESLGFALRGRFTLFRRPWRLYTYRPAVNTA